MKSLNLYINPKNAYILFTFLSLEQTSHNSVKNCQALTLHNKVLDESLSGAREAGHQAPRQSYTQDNIFNLHSNKSLIYMHKILLYMQNMVIIKLYL